MVRISFGSRPHRTTVHITGMSLGYECGPFNQSLVLEIPCSNSIKLGGAFVRVRRDTCGAFWQSHRTCATATQYVFSYSPEFFLQASPACLAGMSPWKTDGAKTLANQIAIKSYFAGEAAGVRLAWYQGQYPLKRLINYSIIHLLKALTNWIRCLRSQHLRTKFRH